MRIGKTRSTVSVIATLTLTALVAAGCSSSSDGDGAKGTSDDPITIDYWGWVPNMDTLVDKWNAANPGIQVNYQAQAAGNDETLAKMSAAVGAGNAPCLAQADVKWMTSMASSGLFEDVTKQAAEYEANYTPGSWANVAIADMTYGVPQDSGPVVFYFNKARFAELGVEVPTTWAEYAVAAAAIHAADPEAYITSFTSDEAEIFQSYVQQAGGNWWSIGDNSWAVDATGPESTKVAELWQGMLEAGSLSNTKRWDPSFYNQVANGQILSVVGAAWQAPLLADNAEATSGDWAVTTMPQWTAGDTVSANNGGSNVTVLKGCKNVEAALKFANSLNTDIEGLTSIGLFPAAKITKIATPEKIAAFFGGQDIYGDLAEAASNVDTTWTFPPIYSSLTGPMGDAVNDAVNKTSTLPSVLTKIQSVSLAEFEKAGITASEK